MNRFKTLKRWIPLSSTSTTTIIGNSAQSSFFPLLLWWLLLLGFFHVVLLSLRLSYRCLGLLTKRKCVHTATVPNIPKYIYLTRSFSSFHNIPYTYSFSAAKLYMDSSTSFQLLSKKLRQCYYSNLDFQMWSDGGIPAADVIPSNQDMRILEAAGIFHQTFRKGT